MTAPRGGTTAALVLGLLGAALLWVGAVRMMVWWAYPSVRAAILNDCSRPTDKKWGMPWEQGRAPSVSACAHAQPPGLPPS
jgi:hypothetical protein